MAKTAPFLVQKRAWRKLTLLLGVLLLPLGGCGFNSTKPTHAGAAGGVGGAAIGAGTGALVGSLISSGDVGASALLGTGIGFPAGAALAYTYVKAKNRAELARLDDAIEAGQAEIDAEEAALLELRREVMDQSHAIEPAPSRSTIEPYTGPTLGTPTR
ncbi:hypothetical protein MRY87_00625 [bacterium]|nr:hypothetical protein [bacterium]